MQPYFFPYIGYWQLINAVDVFVVFDNIQYTKNGWFNRNYCLYNGKKRVFSINLLKDNRFLNVNQRFLSQEYKRSKIISMFQNAYRKAPMKREVFKVIEESINNPANNLFDYIYHSIMAVCKYLEISTKIVVSSTIDIDHSLRSEEKIIAICNKLQADTYINSIGGVDLYSKNNFRCKKIDLRFLLSKPIVYRQFNDEFVENLSILDIMMFNSKETINSMLDEYELIEPTMKIDDFMVKQNSALFNELLLFYEKNAATFVLNLNEQTKDLFAYVSKLKQNATIFEAYYDNVIVGIVAIYLNNHIEKIGFITSVVVAVEHQGKGIAKTLLKSAIDVAVLDNFMKIKLKVCRNNLKAISLYKNLGFKEPSCEGEMELDLQQIRESIE